MFVAAMAFAIAAYVLFFAYDVANVRAPQFKAASLFFLLSCIFVLIATCLMVAISLPFLTVNALTIASFVLSAICFVAMVDALFFSLPKDTYTEPGERRKTYRGKMYSLCRHPGVLWYSLAFVFLMIPFSNPAGWEICVVLVMGNIFYMFLQDLWTFPLIFDDYTDYKRTTPLFVPTPNSLRLWSVEMSRRFLATDEK